MIYSILDFFRRPSGKVFLLCTLAVWAIHIFSSNAKEARSTKSLEGSKLPKITSGSIWDEAGSENGTLEKIARMESPETDRNFQPLILGKSEPPRRVAEDSDQESLNLSETDDEVFTPYLPLVQFQGFNRKAAHPISSDAQLVRGRMETATSHAEKLETGDLLHCQLLSSVSSELPGGPVFARTTRALIRGGKVIVEKGTSLQGRLERVTKSGRLLFGTDWQFTSGRGVAGGLDATAMEKSSHPTSGLLGSDDGRIGLTAVLSSKGNTKAVPSKKILTGFLSAGARLGQSRVKTIFGDEVPLSVRNAVLEGGRDFLERAGGDDQKTGSQPVLTSPAGQLFYLVITSKESASSGE